MKVTRRDEFGDVPVPRDYDKDGKGDPAFWRPEMDAWYGSAID